MSGNCTDTSNQQYELFWFDYFVSIGYIDSSSLINTYAPYGKCTSSALWITYLINLIHFFLLSTGVIYLLSIHQVVDRSGLWWPFITWISSFLFLIAAIVLYVLLNLNVTVFSILIIGFQIAALIILSISIFAVVKVIFAVENRYQKLLIIFMFVLLFLQLGCFIGQVIITLHCRFNLKFISIPLDYSYLSAILAAVGAIISTLLLDHIFMWCIKRGGSSRVCPIQTNAEGELVEDRTTSPVDPVILDYFHRQPQAPYYVYSNSTRTRHFHIRPTNDRPNGPKPNAIKLQNSNGKQNKDTRLSASDA